MAELTLRESGLVNIHTIIGINHMEIVFRDQVGLSLSSPMPALLRRQVRIGPGSVRWHS